MKSFPQKDTKPEMRLRKALHGMGFRYRLHDKRLPGSPDLFFQNTKPSFSYMGSPQETEYNARKGFSSPSSPSSG